ncbi:hypothetical protein SCODD09_01542 [Streptococcus constellatus]|nr:hypothetical protein SCODD09_01542 [Streptococcus constellatus]
MFSTLEFIILSEWETTDSVVDETVDVEVVSSAETLATLNRKHPSSTDATPNEYFRIEKR